MKKEREGEGREKERKREAERERFRQRDTSAIIIPREIIIPAIKRHPGGEGEREEGEGEARRRQQTAKCLAWQVAPFFNRPREPVCFIIHRDHRAEKFTTARRIRVRVESLTITEYSVGKKVDTTEDSTAAVLKYV